MREAVIVSAVRTPLGSYNGSFANMGATDLGGLVIAEAVRRAGIDPVEVNEAIMGQVLGIVYRCIATHLTRKAGFSHKTAYTGQGEFALAKKA